MADQKISQFPLATTFGSTDVLAGVQGGANKKFGEVALRNLFGIKGDWNPANIITPAAPDASKNLEATVATVSPGQYLLTPSAGASMTKLGGSQTVAKESGLHSARIKASTSGGNFLVSGLIITNSTATIADIQASIGGSPVGTVTHFAVIFLDNAGIFGPGTFKVAVSCEDPVNGQQSQMLLAAASYAAGDEVYLSYDPSTSLFSAAVNAGGEAPSTIEWDTSGAQSLRLCALGYFSSSTPTLVDGTIDFDFSTTDGGRTGFNVITDAAIPGLAADGTRWRSVGAGTFAGTEIANGDIVEFYSSTSKVIVDQANPMNDATVTVLANAAIAAAEAAEANANLLKAAKEKKTIIGMYMNTDTVDSTYSTLKVRGVAVLVAPSPFGPFSSFTPYNLAVWDGVSAWVEFEASNFLGTWFTFVDPNAGGSNATITYISEADADYRDDGLQVNGYSVSDFMTHNWLVQKYKKNGQVSAKSVTFNTPGTVSVNIASEFTEIIFNSSGSYIIQTSTPVGYNDLLVVVRALGAYVCNFSFQGFGGGNETYHVKGDSYAVFNYVAGGLIFLGYAGPAATWEPASILYGSAPQGDWSNIGGSEQPLAYKKVGDFVHVRGAVTSSSNSSTLIFALPAGYRPRGKDITVPVTILNASNAPVLGRMVVAQNGEVRALNIADLTDHKVYMCFSFSTNENPA